jgi:hypothetical protein
MTNNFPIPVTMSEDNNCASCGGKCCTYITAVIQPPNDVEDFDHLMWQVSHDNIQVYHDGNDWVLGVRNSNCAYLGKDGYCTNYEGRFFICRDYSNESCGNGEELNDQHIVHFETAEDVDVYAAKRFGAVWTNRFKDHADGKYGNVMEEADEDEELSDEQGLDRLTALEIRFDEMSEAFEDLIDAIDEDGD